MTEDEARIWIETRYGGAVVIALDWLATAIEEENERQNLIAPSTVASIWARHIVDSAQLIALASNTGPWLDVGTGAGFPGLVVAMLRPAPMILVEPRRQRAEFLRRCVGHLGLAGCTVVENKVERIDAEAAVISARAVAPVEKLLHATRHCGTSSTRWLLPRGASGVAELASLQRRWRGVFHMKQSLTDPASTILICDGPERR